MSKKKDGGKPREYSEATEVVLAGRSPFDFEGFVNTPIFRGSTVLSPTVDQYAGHKGKYVYGRRGTPTTDALADALKQLEGGAGVALTPSGLSAITTSLISVVKAGDHLLVTDNAYGPARRFCTEILTPLGIDVEYFDPTIGAAIEKQMKPNTRAIFLESPGSLTFEMSDVSSITAVARKRGAVTIMDNTWATPLYFKPHAHGVDLSLEAGTKYLVGHADANIGWISATEKYWERVKETHGTLGLCPGPEDVFLALRGLRTLSVRLARHMESGIKVARWLQQRPEVLRVFYPALEDDAGHAIWKRDYTGACGLFSLALKPCSEKAVAAFIEALELFGIGASWGGFESLAIPVNVTQVRTATKWNPGGPAVRLHIGLEDTGDLIADLERGFAALKAAS